VIVRETSVKQIRLPCTHLSCCYLCMCVQTAGVNVVPKVNSDVRPPPTQQRRSLNLDDYKKKRGLIWRLVSCARVLCHRVWSHVVWSCHAVAGDTQQLVKMLYVQTCPWLFGSSWCSRKCILTECSSCDQSKFTTVHTKAHDTLTGFRYQFLVPANWYQKPVPCVMGFRYRFLLVPVAGSK